MKMGIWGFVIVSMLSATSFAQNTCSSLFASTKTQAVRNNNKKELNKMTDAIASLVEKRGRIPTEKEIAVAMDVPESAVTAFLSKKSSPDISSLIAIAKQDYPHIFKVFEAQLAKKAAEYLEENLSLPTTKELAQSLDVSEKDIVAIYGGNKDIFSRISEYERKTLEKVTDSLLKAYVKAGREHGRSPTLEEVASVQGSKMTIEGIEALVGKGKLISDINDLYKMAEKKNPKSLKGVVNLEIYNDQKLAALMKDLKEGERLVITTGIAGAPVNKEFLAALHTYYKHNKAPVFVKPVNNETTGLDEALLNEKFVHVLISEVELGSELKISNIPLTAKQINPLAGLNRIGKRGQSMIVGSPKMHMDMVATKDNQFRPHMLLSTGSINDANVYQGEQYISKRTDYMAENDHVMGALIIEKTSANNELVGGSSNGSFHLRHIEYIPEKKGFMDLNNFYTANGVEKVRPEVIGFGDTHEIQSEQRLMMPLRVQVIQTLKPKEVVENDLFDGQSISHYERDKAITLSQKAERGQLNLEHELDLVIDHVRAIFAVAPLDMILSIIDANHNNWLRRYIEAGQFMREPQNTKLGLELAQAMQAGKDPIQYIFEKRLGSAFMRRIVFTNPNEARYVGPEHRKVLISEHGDRGANGAKGSMGAFQRGSDRSGFGHTHTVQRRNGAVNYGTLSKNPMPYAEGGFSNWAQAIMVVGPNGEQQVLIFKNGEFYRDPTKPINSEEFFEQGFPYAKPNNTPTDAVQVDQYTTKRK